MNSWRGNYADCSQNSGPNRLPVIRGGRDELVPPILRSKEVACFWEGRACLVRARLDEQHGWVLEQVSQLLQVFRPESTIDCPMIAAHADRHPMTHQHLIAIVHHWFFCDR